MQRTRFWTKWLLTLTWCPYICLSCYFLLCRAKKIGDLFPNEYKNSAMTTEYTECQAFSPVVRIGSPAPTSKRVLPSPPFGSGGGGHTRLRERGRGGEPIRTKRQTLCYSIATKVMIDVERVRQDMQVVVPPVVAGGGGGAWSSLHLLSGIWKDVTP
jgi:hypothetical protein